MQVTFRFVSIASLFVLAASGCGSPPAARETPVDESRRVEKTGATHPLRAKHIAAGRDHACAITSTGTVACWGANRAGQLGNASAASATVAVDVRGLGEVEAIAAGDLHTCARVAGGTLRCWGGNDRGQLGDGTDVTRKEQAPVLDLVDVTSLASGGAQSCAIKSNGLAACWGEVREGAATKSPAPVFGLPEVKEIAVGALHACGRVADGGVRCWGANNLRQLGVARVAERGMPVVVPELANAMQLALGRDHSCARTSDGEMLCWGGGLRCVPGEWTEGRVVAVKPAKIPGFDHVRFVAAGGDAACAVKADGTVACVRARGAGAGADRACVAEKVAGLADVEEIALGDGFGCALTTAGEVRCWGKNESGQLGIASTNDVALPRPVQQ